MNQTDIYDFVDPMPTKRRTNVKCEWCGQAPATRQAITRDGKQRTVKGQKVWINRITLDVCGECEQKVLRQRRLAEQREADRKERRKQDRDAFA